ncbi:MAG: hypothetical protein U0350_50780 [Caldilineaceae bacterium]
MTWTRRDWLILVAVTLLAAALRFYQLGVVPPGFQFDEAFNAIDARQILHGNYPLFLPANAGREVLYSYLQAGLLFLLGQTAYALRLASALAGITAIPTTYLLLRRLLHQHSQKIAAFTSLTLAISLWHIHFSHYGIRVILMPPLLCAIFGLYWVGMEQGQGARSKEQGARSREQGARGEGQGAGSREQGARGEGQGAGSKEQGARSKEQGARSKGQGARFRIPHSAFRILALLGSGILTGVSVWTHPTGRFVPFVLILYTLWLWGRYPQRRGWTSDNPLEGLVLTGGLAFLVFLPLGLAFYHHPEWFTGHAAEVSVFAARVSGDSPLKMLLTNIVRVLGMFSFRGDQEWAHNLAGRPVFDPLLSLPFMLGLGLWGKRLWQRRPDDPDVDALFLCALWVFVMLTPSIFSEAAPNFSRTLPSLPATFVAAGLGLQWLADWRPFRWWPTYWPFHFGALLTGLILAVSGSLAAYDYFVRFPQRPEVYYLYDADKLDALAYLSDLGEQSEVYMDRLWAEHPPVMFMRSSKLVKSLDMSDTLVLPPVGRGAVYAFPAEKAKEATRLAKFWHGVQAETTKDRFGNLLLGLTKVPATQLTDWPAALQPTNRLEAHFVDAPTLLGMQATPNSSTLLLFWRAEVHTLRSLTTFIHLLDADGQRVGQADKLPGNDSYVTTVWSPGERVIDRYSPEISDPCAGGEQVRVQVGWYELAANGARRPRADASGDTALAGQMTLPIVAYPFDQIKLPNQLNLPVNRQLTLLSATLHETDWQAGAPFTVDLYWRGGQVVANQKISLQLANEQRSLTLWDGPIAPQTTWRTGDVICRRLRLRLPTELATGAYQLAVATPEQRMPFQTLTVNPSTRQFTVPPLAQRVEATFGETIRLLGYNVAQPTTGVTHVDVTLVWQAQSIPQGNYTVFVHLLNDKGEIVAQSDAVPNGGYTTDRWVTGEVVSDTHHLNLPAPAQPGVYRIVTGLYDAVSGQRLTVVDKTGQALPDSIAPLGEIRFP